MNNSTSNVGLASLLALSLSATALADNNLEQRHQAAMETTQSFVQQLGKAMKGAMKSGGPEAAIKVCSERAPVMTGEISRSKGWKVTRVGTRVRNPMLGMPDIWEQKVLTQFQARLDEGEALLQMSHAELVTEPDGQYFRFMKAIGVKPQCLVCHGSDSDIPQAVQAVLRERYPHDKARDYKVGDLRGAVSIKQPIKRM